MLTARATGQSARIYGRQVHENRRTCQETGCFEQPVLFPHLHHLPSSAQSPRHLERPGGHSSFSSLAPPPQNTTASLGRVLDLGHNGGPTAYLCNNAPSSRLADGHCYHTPCAVFCQILPSRRGGFCYAL